MPRAKPRAPLPVGSVYERVYKKKPARMTVVKQDGKIGYKVGQTVYSSPSSAAKSITKREVNGWAFWHIDDRA